MGEREADATAINLTQKPMTCVTMLLKHMYVLNQIIDRLDRSKNLEDYEKILNIFHDPTHPTFHERTAFAYSFL